MHSPFGSSLLLILGTFPQWVAWFQKSFGWINIGYDRSRWPIDQCSAGLWSCSAKAETNSKYSPFPVRFDPTRVLEYWILCNFRSQWMADERCSCSELVIVTSKRTSIQWLHVGRLGRGRLVQYCAAPHLPRLASQLSLAFDDRHQLTQRVNLNCYNES